MPHCTIDQAPTDRSLVTGTLNRASLVRWDKIYTLDQELIVKRFGQVKPEILDRIHTVLQQILLPTLSPTALSS
jgi:mRNA-degrading endonuclease toxin of MazEF toxin-antitoxin module